jgi:UDP-3-O-[3-hydroxymyristoyl] glucosamine N-acyltransferase
MANAVVAPGCVLGDRVVLNPGAIVGGDGYGFAPTATGHQKIPQLGGVELADDVEVGANSCIDRSALPGSKTTVGAGSKLDNLVQVGHGATLGRGVRMVAYSGVAGSSTLGDHVTLAAKAAVLGHRTIGHGVSVGAASVVHNAQPDGARVSGVPAIDHRTWLRAATAFSDLPELLRTLRDLRRRVKALEEARDHE